MPAFALAASLVLAQSTGSVPERILLNITQDPATSAAVTWRTAENANATLGQLAPSSPDPRFESLAIPTTAKTTEVRLPQGGRAFYHEVRFGGLVPDTEYLYRVGDGNVWSEWIAFRTAKAYPAPFRFIYFGDAQNSVKSMWSRVVRRAFRDAPYAAFMLHAGDLINLPNADHEWAEWFYAGGWVHASIPSVPSPGNHEYARVPNTQTRELSIFWKPQFATPENGPPGLERTCYYFDYQGARVISLNSNERQAEQATWLDTVLRTNPHPWSFVTFHHPVYSTASGRDNPEIRRLWGPIFQKHNVTLVLQGHDHSYGRKNVPTGLTKQDPRSGTVYVVSVSGPKMYRLNEAARSMTKVGEFTQLFQIIDVEPRKVRFQAFTSTGELYDAFELTKNRDGSNRLRELRGTIPSRTEPVVAPRAGGQ